MENLRKALEQYLLAKDAKSLQIALDAMTPAIKLDIVATIEETIKEAMDTHAPGVDLQAKNFQSLKIKNYVNGLLSELKLDDDSMMNNFAA